MRGFVDTHFCAFTISQGALYVFTKNIAAGVGAVTNATCVGRAIDLDPREPDDDLAQPYRVLKYPPLAVWVEPLEAPVALGDACGPRAPRNCMPITLDRAKAACVFNPSLMDDDVEVTKWRGHRHAFPLGDGYCVTDYYAQGQSFRGYPWFAHLGKPDGGSLVRASVLVTLTRFRDWDAVRPWTRLWRDGDDEGRASVISSFYNAAKPSADLAAELLRLREQEARTLREVPRRIHDLLL